MGIVRMTKFLEYEFDELNLDDDLSKEIPSMAGGDYLEHVQEIDDKIDRINRSNIDGYRKAAYCLIK